MDCAQFEQVVEGLDSVSTRGAAVSGTALAHAELCDECARLFLAELLKSQIASDGDKVAL